MPRRKVPDPIAQAVGQRIRQLRLESGMTAETLAFSGELSSKGFISDIEHGLARPSLKTLQEIAHLLGVSLLDLVTFPAQDERQALIDRTRHLPVSTIRKLLEELAKSRPATGSAGYRAARNEPQVLLVNEARKSKRPASKKR